VTSMMIGAVILSLPLQQSHSEHLLLASNGRPFVDNRVAPALLGERPIEPIFLW
jgi:hypothetical protein